MLNYEKIKRGGITFITGCKVLPPSGYSAITLFGYVLTRKTKEDVEKYLDTPRGKVWANHENIHILQKEALHSWLLFYTLYIWYFIIAWPFFMSWKQAYTTIPFEYEAYSNQENLNYAVSNWKIYVKDISGRKAIHFT